LAVQIAAQSSTQTAQEWICSSSLWTHWIATRRTGYCCWR